MASGSFSLFFNYKIVVLYSLNSTDFRFAASITVPWSRPASSTTQTVCGRMRSLGKRVREICAGWPPSTTDSLGHLPLPTNRILNGKIVISEDQFSIFKRITFVGKDRIFPLFCARKFYFFFKILKQNIDVENKMFPIKTLLLYYFLFAATRR